MKSSKEVGSIRILTDGLSVVKKTKFGWKKISADIPKVFDVIRLFKKNNYLKALVDVESPRFLKGGLTAKGRPFGARIDVLPSKHKLDKAYSIFADGLMIHDELSNSHWDVIFMNPNGKYSYLYSLGKKRAARVKKYLAVDDFEKSLGKINRAVNKGVATGDIMALAMRTLLQTKMRVGSEVYYKAHGHKGLTTLKKEDVKIAGNKVTFSFISKDGVPQEISEGFSREYVESLKKVFRKLKGEDFIFAKSGRPLKDVDFKKAFEIYCGEGFYPHIVRSHYATGRGREFLREHKKASKDEIEKFFGDVAEKLGHKKFSKGEWKTDYSTTIHYYIRPDFVEKILRLEKI